MSTPAAELGIAEEPVVADPEPTHERLSPGAWVRANLFGSALDTVLTVVFGSLLLYVIFRALRFVFVTARWEIIERNLTLATLGRFPREQLYRPWLAIALVAVLVGIGVGTGIRRRREDGEAVNWIAGLRRATPLVLLAVGLLAFTRTPTPALLTLGALGLYGLGLIVGQRLPPRVARRLPVVWLLGLIGVYAAFTGFGGVGWDSWGGLLLTLFLALGGITLSFPFGVLLALGRRSSLPAVRVASVGYIELIRGVPLITLLLMGQFVLGFFLPSWLPRPGLVMRAMIALILFTAAYVAEIVRGGLQGVPEGQTEAAQALGLPAAKTTRLIVLPQALRNVIPALVGQFISLFKDTSLVAIIGLLDLLLVAQNVNGQPDFNGQGLQAETLAFASFVYWSFCYYMSRESQRLERRLGVGTR